MLWICRIVFAFIGLHACGRHPDGLQSWARARPPRPPSRLAMAGRITGDDRGTLLPDHQHTFVGEH